MENLLGGLAHALDSGRWPTAASDGKVAYVAREDAARTAAAALLAATPPHGVFDVTGPGVDELHFTVVGVIKDIARLKLLYELFAETLNELCRIGSAYETPPEVTL
jgi:hypothetical protein